MKRLLAIVAVLLAAAPALAQKMMTDGIKDLATQIAGSVAKEQKKKIAVLPFKELDGQTTVLGTYLAEELVTNLFNVGNVDIVERAMLDKLLGEQKLEQTGAIDPATAQKVGKIAGVDAIVTGSVTDFQSFIAVNCRVIDTTSGRIFAAAQVKIVKDDDVKKALSMTVGGKAPAPASAPPATPAKPKSSGKPSWMQGDVRVVVDSAKREGQRGIVVLALETTGTESEQIKLGDVSLLDANGDRWKLDSDSEGFAWRGVTVIAGVRARSVYSFSCWSGECNATTFAIVNSAGNALVRDVPFK